MSVCSEARTEALRACGLDRPLQIFTPVAFNPYLDAILFRDLVTSAQQGAAAQEHGDIWMLAQTSIALTIHWTPEYFKYVDSSHCPELHMDYTPAGDAQTPNTLETLRRVTQLALWTAFKKPYVHAAGVAYLRQGDDTRWMGPESL